MYRQLERNTNILCVRIDVITDSEHIRLKGWNFRSLTEYCRNHSTVASIKIWNDAQTLVTLAVIILRPEG